MVDVHDAIILPDALDAPTIRSVVLEPQRPRITASQCEQQLSVL